jgi:hypothetical protein
MMMQLMHDASPALPDSPAVEWRLVADVAGLVAGAVGPVRIPVHRDAQDAPYNVEVCGFRLEADDPGDLVRPVGRLLRGLTNAARLPTFVFVARRSHRLYPVYAIGDEVLATTPGGPVFRHVELSQVRDRLTDYLHAVGELGAPGKSDVLHVRGVARTSLSLVRPLFYLKKRPRAACEHEFWAPVFPSSDGHGIHTYAASGRREVDLAGGHEVLLLRRQVAQALQADGRLHEDLDLQADRLLPGLWDRVAETVMPHVAMLTTPSCEYPVFRAGRDMMAVERRRGEDRYTLHLGRDLADLRRRMGADLVRRGELDQESRLI